MKSGMAYLANSRSDLLHGAFQQVSYQIEVGFAVQHWAVSGDDGFCIELGHILERLHPFSGIAIIGIWNGMNQQIARD